MSRMSVDSLYNYIKGEQAMSSIDIEPWVHPAFLYSLPNSQLIWPVGSQFVCTFLSPFPQPTQCHCVLCGLRILWNMAKRPCKAINWNIRNVRMNNCEQLRCGPVTLSTFVRPEPREMDKVLVLLKGRNQVPEQNAEKYATEFLQKVICDSWRRHVMSLYFLLMRAASKLWSAPTFSVWL